MNIIKGMMQELAKVSSNVLNDVIKPLFGRCIQAG